MTTFHQVELTCAICGSKSEQMTISSTNSMGSRDLDLRPPEMQRSTMECWVQECPTCGYAYSSIEEKADNSAATMSSPAYEEVLSGQLNGSLIGSFLKSSLMAEGAADIRAAADYALNAAWAADDLSDTMNAKFNRYRAVSLFEKLLKVTDYNAEETTVTRTIMVDILRRSRQWDEAINLANILLSQKLDPTIELVLKFEISQASQNDTQCYTIAEALEAS